MCNKPSQYVNDLKVKKKVLVAQQCLTFFDPMDCSPRGSSGHGILQARIPEWMPFLSPGDLPNPGMEPGSPALQTDSFLCEPPGKPVFVIDKLLASY